MKQELVYLAEPCEHTFWLKNKKEIKGLKLSPIHIWSHRQFLITYCCSNIHTSIATVICSSLNTCKQVLKWLTACSCCEVDEGYRCLTGVSTCRKVGFHATKALPAFTKLGAKRFETSQASSSSLRLSHHSFPFIFCPPYLSLLSPRLFFLSARSSPPSVCSQHIDCPCLCLCSSCLLILS